MKPINLNDALLLREVPEADVFLDTVTRFKSGAPMKTTLQKMPCSPNHCSIYNAQVREPLLDSTIAPKDSRRKA
jgi:hypothetical protein